MRTMGLYSTSSRRAAHCCRWASPMRSTALTIVLSLLSCVASADVDLNDSSVPERLGLKEPDWTEVRALLEKRTAEGYMLLGLYWNSSERWVEAKATKGSDRKAGAYFSIASSRIAGTKSMKP